MSMDSARSSGSWATRHMCPAFCQKNHRCAIQHTWTHLRGSWKSFDCNNKPAKRCQRPTWITDYAEHFFGSTWASHYSYNLETSATTGVTRPRAVLQSWSGVDRLQWSCVSPGLMDLTQMSTGLAMGQSCWEQPQSTSRQQRLSKMWLRRQEILWTRPNRPWTTSAIAEWLTTSTSTRATSDIEKRSPPTRRPTTWMKIYINFLDINFHQTDGKSRKMADFGRGFTTPLAESSMCQSL